mgnify:CR=1 FL=1|jgi:hypothetical protein
MNNILEWLKSPKGQDFRLLLDVSVGVMLFLWLIKGRK